MTAALAADSYIARMGLSFATHDGRTSGRFPPAPALCAADGRVRLGAMAALCDCLVGYRAVGDFAGAWIGTSELAIFGPSGPAPDGVEAEADLLRRRRQGGVYEVTARAGTDTLAMATVTLGVLSRQGEPKVPATVAGAAAGGPEALTSLDHLLSLEPLKDGDGTALHLDAGLRNSWGVLAGGIITMLAEAEAERAAASLIGPCAVEGLALHFLAPGRVGPIEARATLFGPHHGGSRGQAAVPPAPLHLKVGLIDAGADERLVATASVIVVPCCTS